MTMIFMLSEDLAMHLFIDVGYWNDVMKNPCRVRYNQQGEKATAHDDVFVPFKRLPMVR